MTYILIDPLIVMTPPDDASKEDVESWFHSLNTWLKEALTAPFTWLHYLQASHLLQEHGRFPNFSELKHLQRQYRLDINISQTARSINEFFRDEELDLATYIDRLEFVIEPDSDSFLVQPPQFISRLPDYILDGFSILLANCCVCKHISAHLGEKLHIATFALQDNARTITVSTIILAAEPDAIRNNGDAIIHAFPLVITPDDLPSLNDIIDVWSRGEEMIIYALQQELRKQAATANIKPFTFYIGPHFINSINEHGLGTNEVVLRSIMRAAVNIILNRAKDINSYSLHEMRVSETADSPQRVRASDNGQAWRLKLQQRGAGWRLHYWQTPTPEGPLIEFANVGKESEREIL